MKAILVDIKAKTFAEIDYDGERIRRGTIICEIKDDGRWVPIRGSGKKAVHKPTISIDGVPYLIANVLYELKYGPLPDKSRLQSKTGDRCDVNPDNQIVTGRVSNNPIAVQRRETIAKAKEFWLKKHKAGRLLTHKEIMKKFGLSRIITVREIKKWLAEVGDPVVRNIDKTLKLAAAREYWQAQLAKGVVVGHAEIGKKFVIHRNHSTKIVHDWLREAVLELIKAKKK